jgi:isoaspartyl peptidase/L-asparaginase-like protein (Ntn-hydrolase superfamily)
MTIAIRLSAGDFSYLTATGTQVTYTSGAKGDSGKIRGAWRREPIGAINIAGAGDSSSITALSQEIVKMFQKFSGSANQLEERIDAIVHTFYKKRVLPFIAKLDDANVPDYSLLIAAR